VETGREAEEVGFDGVFVPDHLAGPETVSTDSLELLESIASETTRIALGTSVLSSIRRTSEQIGVWASRLQQKSHGRVIIGIGAGDYYESKRLNLCSPCSTRLAGLAEGLYETSLWSNQGRDASTTLSLPSRSGCPPLWIAGETPCSMQIAATWGDGWFSQILSPEEMKRRLNLFRFTLHDAKREPNEVTVAVFNWLAIAEDHLEKSRLLSYLEGVLRVPRLQHRLIENALIGSRSFLKENLRMYAEAGVRALVLVVPQYQLENVADEILPSFRSS